MEQNNTNSYKKPTTFAGGRIASQNRWLDTGLGKVPPQALDLEEAVLGALMIEKDALTTVVDILKADSFYKEAHQRIYGAITTLFASSEPIDLLTVQNQLRSTGELEIAGGISYLAELTQRVNSAANIEFHARIVVEHSLKRQLITVSSEIQKMAYEDTTDVFQLLDKVEQELFRISEANIRKNYADMSSIMRTALLELEAKKNQKDGLTGVPTGFSALDRVTSGFQKTELIIIAARPGMGKCLGKGTKVLMFDGSLKKVEDIVTGELLMGDDSTPRRVKSIARGQERMYWIRQNKGMDYRVNESHILSLKRSRNEGNHQHGDVLNITVKDYLTKSDKFKSNYKGYKVAVEFEEQQLSIEPYFLGLWLGDGHAYSSRITNVDEEIISYLSDYADNLNQQVSVYQQKGKTTNYAITKGYKSKSGFSISSELRKHNLLQNKHIPQNFLINSTENRLQLLAGLLDSDGHYLIDSNGYEITQKSLELAQQIKFLCDSLGFRTSLTAKKASIASRGFESEVYRIRIYGDVDKIPVRIARKKAKAWASPVDWRMTGITVEYDKVDDYYGFEIDGNRLFLLEDMTVTHNTALILSACRNAAVDFGQAVAVFSLEMSSVQLVNRLISAEAELESEKLRKGNLAPHEWAQLHAKIGRLTNAPIFIDDTPALSILELRAKARRLKAQHDIQMIVIDYLQLMSGDSGGKGTGNREQEIANISRSLKQLAKELDVPVIALSQLSRAVETRGGDKRPQLSDLRESGSIEQDADMVMFIYRPEYYGITQDESGNSVAGIGELIIAKNRAGSLDTVQLRFIGKFTKYCDVDSGDYSSFSNNGGESLQSFSAIPDPIAGFEGGARTFGSRINSSSNMPENNNGGNTPPSFGSTPPNQDVPF
ncbi:MAG: replicative DNA helicase [Spirosomataceae bacterium]